MRIIKELSAMIEDEIEGAECYIKTALRYKDSDPTTANLLYSLAKEEMGHMDRLHEAVVREIKAARAEHGDPPVGMQEFYDYLHEAHMKHSSEIQWYISQYAEK